MSEKHIIAALREREHFDRYHKYIKVDLLSDVGRRALYFLNKYFEETPHAAQADAESMEHYLNHVYAGKLKDEERTCLDELYAAEPGEDDLLTLINSLETRALAEDVIDICHGVLEGEDGYTLEHVQNYLNSNAVATSSNPDNDLLATDFQSLIRMEAERPGYNWRLTVLNDCYGPVRGGDLIVVAARPNTGKTSLIISETVQMMPQMKEGKQVVWFNNEESGDKIARRYYAAAAGVPWQELKTMPQEQARKLCADYPLTNVKMFDIPGGTATQIERTLDACNPGVIVINNLDKVSVGDRGDGNRAVHLTELYQWARKIAKKYDAVVFAIGQAGATAENQKFIRMDMLDGSKTGKAGEADLIIGIANHESGAEDMRYISIAKNKSEYGKGLRSPLECVSFRGDVALYEDLA